jgi:cytochrome c553
VIAGLLRAAVWARRWAATSQFSAGDRAERVIERLGSLLSRDDQRALEAHYGALALLALARALQTEADREVTDADIELDDPTPVRR